MKGYSRDVLISSPTYAIAVSSPLIGALQGSTTFQISVDGSSVTLQGQGVGVLASTQTFSGTNTFANHIQTTVTGTRPSLGACGVSPSTSTFNTDISGKITAGSGLLTSCAMNFGVTWTNPPACSVTSGTAIASLTVTTTSSQMVIGGTSLTSDAISYICMGSQ